MIKNTSPKGSEGSYIVHISKHRSENLSESTTTKNPKIRQPIIFGSRVETNKRYRVEGYRYIGTHKRYVSYTILACGILGQGVKTGVATMVSEVSAYSEPGALQPNPPRV